MADLNAIVESTIEAIAKPTMQMVADCKRQNASKKQTELVLKLLIRAHEDTIRWLQSKLVEVRHG